MGVPLAQVDLTQVNKYVGYSEAKCKIDFGTVKAEVQLVVPASNSEARIVPVLLTIDRIARQVIIDHLSPGQTQQRYDGNKLQLVRLPKSPEQRLDTDYDDLRYSQETESQVECGKVRITADMLLLRAAAWKNS